MGFFSRFNRKSGKSDDALYAQVWREVESKNVDEGLWARLWAENKGHEEKTKAAYLNERVKQLGESSNSAESPRTDQVTEQTDQIRITNSDKTNTFRVPSSKAIVFVSALIVLSSFIAYRSWGIAPIGWLIALGLWLAIAGSGRQNSQKYYMRLKMATWTSALVLVVIGTHFQIPGVEFGSTADTNLQVLMKSAWGIVLLPVGLSIAWFVYRRKAQKILFDNVSNLQPSTANVIDEETFEEGKRQTSKRVIKWFVWISLAIVILFVLLQTGLGPDTIQASQLGVMKALLMLAAIAPFLLFGKLVHRFFPKFTYAASCGLGFIIVVALVAVGSVLFR